MADAQHLPHGRYQAGDRHLNFHETRDNLNLIASAGLVPAPGLADRIGLRELADEWLSVPGSRGTAEAKVMSLVAGMLAGADSIDDMDRAP